MCSYRSLLSLLKLNTEASQCGNKHYSHCSSWKDISQHRRTICESHTKFIHWRIVKNGKKVEKRKDATLCPTGDLAKCGV